MPITTIRGVGVDFPHRPYDCQLVYMEKVITALQTRRNALLESPTGTGKASLKGSSPGTIAYETPAGSTAAAAAYEAEAAAHIRRLAGMTSEDPHDLTTGAGAQFGFGAGSGAGGAGLGGVKTFVAPRRSAPTIIYASRTHSQLTQVVNELKKTVYAPKTNSHCRTLVRNRTCKFHRNVENFTKPETAGIQDIEELANMGRAHEVCPYYYTRSPETLSDADVVFVPYNYIIDRNSRRGLDLQWDNCIVIFDEAHNLDSVCADSASFDLTAVDVAACMEEVDQAMEMLLAGEVVSGGDVSKEPLLPEEANKIKALLADIEEAIDSIELPGGQDSPGLVKPGPFIFDFFARFNITFVTKEVLISKLKQMSDLLLGDDSHRQYVKLDSLITILKAIFSQQSRELSHCYKVLFHEDTKQRSRAQRQKQQKSFLSDGGKASGSGRTLSYWCFSPGVAFADLSKLGVRSVIVTSGTLAPLPVFAQELRTNFEVQLENPHVISREQICVAVVPKGVTGKTLNSSFKNRESPDYITELGNTITNFARIIPDGLLVFFPSYYMMYKCVDFWTSEGTYKRMAKYKTVVVEPRSSGEVVAVATAFKDAVDAGLGAIFFAVCRGKISEGIDFPNQYGRAVVVTGLPYPPYKDPRVMLKRQFMDEARRSQPKLISGHDWYAQQASRAVNQAVGRTIRHKGDYGAILLCDRRFADPVQRQRLSLWLRPYWGVCKSFGQCATGLTRFFKTASVRFGASRGLTRNEPNGASSFGFVGSRGTTAAAAPAPPAPPQDVGGVHLSNPEALRRLRERRDARRREGVQSLSTLMDTDATGAGVGAGAGAGAGVGSGGGGGGSSGGGSLAAALIAHAQQRPSPVPAAAASAPAPAPAAAPRAPPKNKARRHAKLTPFLQALKKALQPPEYKRFKLLLRAFKEANAAAAQGEGGAVEGKGSSKGKGKGKGKGSGGSGKQAGGTHAGFSVSGLVSEVATMLDDGRGRTPLLEAFAKFLPSKYAAEVRIVVTARREGREVPLATPGDSDVHASAPSSAEGAGVAKGKGTKRKRLVASASPSDPDTDAKPAPIPIKQRIQDALSPSEYSIFRKCHRRFLDPSRDVTRFVAALDKLLDAKRGRRHLLRELVGLIKPALPAKAALEQVLARDAAVMRRKERLRASQAAAGHSTRREGHDGGSKGGAGLSWSQRRRNTDPRASPDASDRPPRKRARVDPARMSASAAPPQSSQASHSGAASVSMFRESPESRSETAARRLTAPPPERVSRHLPAPRRPSAASSALSAAMSRAMGSRVSSHARRMFGGAGSGGGSSGRGGGGSGGSGGRVGVGPPASVEGRRSVRAAPSHAINKDLVREALRRRADRGRPSGPAPMVGSAASSQQHRVAQRGTHGGLDSRGGRAEHGHPTQARRSSATMARAGGRHPSSGMSRRGPAVQDSRSGGSGSDMLGKLLKSGASVAFGTSTAAKSSQPRTSRPFVMCVVCRDAAKPAYVAQCGHVACKSCWIKCLVVRQECPVCRQLTRINFLRKLNAQVELDA